MFSLHNQLVQKSLNFFIDPAEYDKIQFYLLDINISRRDKLYNHLQKFPKEMSFKLCFNKEIHRISKLPTTFSDLQENVRTNFQSNLPKQWALQYLDADGDEIRLSNEDAYKDLIEEIQETKKTVKVTIVSLQDLSRTSFEFSEEDHIIGVVGSNDTLISEITNTGNFLAK